MLVTKNVVTREEVIAAVKELAGELGRSPRYPEVIREVSVTRRQDSEDVWRVGGRPGGKRV